MYYSYVILLLMFCSDPSHLCVRSLLALIYLNVFIDWKGGIKQEVKVWFHPTPEVVYVFHKTWIEKNSFLYKSLFDLAQPPASHRHIKPDSLGLVDAQKPLFLSQPPALVSSDPEHV